MQKLLVAWLVFCTLTCFESPPAQLQKLLQQLLLLLCIMCEHVLQIGCIQGEHARCGHSCESLLVNVHCLQNAEALTKEETPTKAKCGPGNSICIPRVGRHDRKFNSARKKGKIHGLNAGRPCSQEQPHTTLAEAH